MSRFVGEGKRTPEPGLPPELPGPIETLTGPFRELSGKRDRRPPQLAEQRLEQYRDKLRAHLAAVRSELDATKASIVEIRTVLVRQYAVAQASWRPAEALTVPCPACGQACVPHRAAAAGRGWRKGWYECPADDCNAAWSARWSGGAHPVVKMGGL